MPDAGNVETRDASSAGAEVRIAGLDHVVLRVGNLDRAIEFYERVLNCRVERRLEQPKLVQLRAGASLIDLVPASASPGERRHGIEVGEVRERYGAEGYGPSLYISDPDGNTVELKGPATRGL
jgi:glyoxylase I family protein